jgi:6-phosphogluconolactonase
VASNPSGSTNIDLAASADGKFLYTLNTSAGKIGVFAVDALTGRLTNLGAQGEIPTSAGADGIAAN